MSSAISRHVTENPGCDLRKQIGGIALGRVAASWRTRVADSIHRPYIHTSWYRCMYDDSVDSFVDARQRRHGSIPVDVDAAISLERPSRYSPFSSFPSIAAENECQLTRRAGEACGDDLYRLNRTTLLALLLLLLPVLSAVAALNSALLCYCYCWYCWWCCCYCSYHDL